MNSKIGRLLEDYRQADITKRLHLFLEYPELRAAFTDIESGPPEVEASAVKRSPRPKAARVCGWPRFLRPGIQSRFCR